MNDDEQQPEGKTTTEKATSKGGPASNEPLAKKAAASLGYEDEDAGKTKFGMFEGVFAQAPLNIWGVIVVPSHGWMVAHAGAWLASSIIVVAMVITLITTLSLSAICTNGEEIWRRLFSDLAPLWPVASGRLSASPRTRDCCSSPDWFR